MVAEEAKKVADERRGDSLDAFVLRVHSYPHSHLNGISQLKPVAAATSVLQGVCIVAALVQPRPVATCSDFDLAVMSAPGVANNA